MWSSLPRPPLPMYHLPYIRHTGEGGYCPVAPPTYYNPTRPVGAIHVRGLPRANFTPPLPPPTPLLPSILPRRKPTHHRHGIESDLEWDDFECCADDQSDSPDGSDNESTQSVSTCSHSELEWDDFDLRNSGDEAADVDASLAMENLFPLLNSITSKPIGRRGVPLGAVQVRKLPRITCTFAGLAHVPEEFCYDIRSRSLNKDLLTLTSKLNGYDSDLWDYDDDFQTTKLGKTFSNESLNSDISTVSTQESGYRSSGTAKSRDTPDLPNELNDSLAESYGDGSVVDYYDHFADYNYFYKLSPHCLDSPLSASLTDLSDATLCHSTTAQYPLSLRFAANQKGKRSVKKRKRKAYDKVDDDVAVETEEDKKSKRLAPNYFVAIQVSNPEIHQNLRNVQLAVMQSDEKLKDAMIPIPTLHLTVMVMHIANDEELERARDALQTCQALLAPQFEDDVLTIPFAGLGHFNNQVMFARIQDGEHVNTLYGIAEMVEKVFNQYNIVSTGDRGFKPHLTVMKLSRAPSLRRKGVRRIKSEYYRNFNSEYFGSQIVKGLQLCSINKPKLDDGYYWRAEEIYFYAGKDEADRMETVTMSRMMINDIIDEAIDQVEIGENDEAAVVPEEEKENKVVIATVSNQTRTPVYPTEHKDETN